MKEILIPIDVFNLIIEDKNKRKLFIIYTLLRSNMNFPTVAFGADAKKQMTSAINKTNRTIDNYLKIAINIGLIIKEDGNFNLITEWQLFKKFKKRFRPKPFVKINFNYLKPTDSLINSAITIFLKKQEIKVKEDIYKFCGDASKVNHIYNNVVNNIEKSVYYPGTKNLPPLLTQAAIANMLGLKSPSSGFYIKKKLKESGIIEIKKMKKRKIQSTNKRFPFQFVKRNPPDIAIFSGAKKTDCTLISFKI